MSLPPFVSRQVQQARRYFWNLTPDPQADLALVCGGCERVAPDYLIQRGDFPYYCIEFVAEGQGEAVLEGVRRALYPGVAFAYGPGVPHAIRTAPETPLLKYYVDFTGKEAEGLLLAAGLLQGASILVTPADELIQLFENLQRDSASEHPAAGAICTTLLRLLLLKMQERAVPAQTSQPRSLALFLEAKTLLERNALQWFSAEPAALHCQISPEYLIRIFRTYAHTTPYRFLMRLKMSRAAELLLDSQLKVREIAEELGFSDPFHFSRAFKRFHGASPEHFLRRVQRGLPSPKDSGSLRS